MRQSRRFQPASSRYHMLYSGRNAAAIIQAIVKPYMTLTAFFLLIFTRHSKLSNRLSYIFVFYI